MILFLDANRDVLRHVTISRPLTLFTLRRDDNERSRNATLVFPPKGVNRVRWDHLMVGDRPGLQRPPSGHPIATHSLRLWKQFPARTQARCARDAPTASLSAAATARCPQRLTRARQPRPSARLARAERRLWKCQTGIGRGTFGKKLGHRAGSRGRHATFGGRAMRQ